MPPILSLQGDVLTIFSFSYYGSCISLVDNKKAANEYHHPRIWAQCSLINFIKYLYKLIL